MSFSARCVPPVLCTILSLAVTLWAQSTTSQTTKTPRGSISGRVTIKDKGAVGVAIGLRRSDNSNPFEPFTKTTTDHDGFYHIDNLPPGAYQVTPSAPAFVTAGNNNPNSKTVVVAEDENVDDINFSLVRGGVITGKVTDADGRPLIMQQVYLYRSDAFDQQAQQQQQQRPVYSQNSAITDDRGIYRMYGLMAGRYKVASGRAEEGFVGASSTRNTYKQAFHPDVSEHARANVIVVTEGSEANNVDITLGRAQSTFTASGRVIDTEKNAPVPNLPLGVQRVVGQRIEIIPTMASTNAQGDFIFEGLIPGKYTLYIFQMGLQNPYPDLRAEQTSFDIMDQDLSGLTVRLTKGASLTGIVVLESEDKTAFQKLQQLQLRALMITTPGSAGFGQSSVSAIAADGSFRLGGLAPGTANIYLGSAMGPINMRGFMIARIERDGVVLPTRLEVREAEQISGLRIVVAYGNATLRGVVRFENGSLPPGGQIIARVMKPGESIPRIPSAQVDARGHFILEGIPAGMYELHVSVTPGGPGLSRRVTQGVNLQDGVVTDVVVTIDLGAAPK